VVNLLGRCDTGIMAGSAVVCIDAQMVERYTCKCIEVTDIVTIRATQRCWYMVQRLPKADVTVMACFTVIHDTGMIE